jgi:TolB-like protein/Tfp pilus assembly protein PilF
MKGVISELKRRNVFRVALTYAVAAWIVAQVAGLAADAFAAPPWVMQMIIVALIIGFLPAVVVAWAFELTPEGIRRERDLVDRETVNRYTARRLNIAVIFLLVLAIGLLVGDRYLGRPAPVAGDMVAASDTASQTWSLDSIAVLPFADFSPARDQAWLGEGIADTLLHALAQVEGLSVSARSSSFAYRDREADVATMGRELGVATILEGSVQRVGDRLRVSAQLVRTDTQAQLFSRTFDRETDDIFAIQDEIAAAVTEALLGSTEAAPSASARTAASTYDLYLEGRQLWQERTTESVNRAVELLARAVADDPGYAPAQAELALALMFQVFYADVPVEDNRAAVERHIQRALDLERDNALAWAARGHLLQELGLEADGLEALHRAERLDPGNANIQVWVGNRHFAIGRLAEAAERFERALELDPLNPFVRQRFMATLGSLNSSDARIERVARDSVRLFPEREDSWQTLLNLLANQDRMDETVLMAHDGSRQFPEDPSFKFFIALGLERLGLYEDSDRWQAKAKALAPDDPMWLSAQLFERDPEEHLRRAEAQYQRWGEGNLPYSYWLHSLRMHGRSGEALALFKARYAELRPRLEANTAGLEDYGLLVEGLWLARAEDEAELAEDLRVRIETKLDELRELGLMGDLFIPDLHMAVARGDMDRARELLGEMPEQAVFYLSGLLRLDPIFAELADTAEGQALIVQAEARRDAMRERLQAEAPAGLLL